MGHLNLISLLGIFVMIGLAWAVSSHRARVNWRLVVVGVLLQAMLAAMLFQSQNWTFDEQFQDIAAARLAVEAGGFPLESVETFLQAHDSDQAVEATEISIPRYPQGILFSGVDSFFAAVNAYVSEGSNFVFKAYDVEGSQPANATVMLRTFAFGVLPTVIFFASLMSILYHLGVMQFVIKVMSGVMQKTLGTSGPESMAAAANVLVGHTEAPLVIRPYLEKMTRSELNALMVGGFATISGSLMAIFVFYGISAGHLLTASIISAPAALVIAKVLQPETETPPALDELKRAPEQHPTNVIEAAAIGASDGVKIAINITGMLIAFLALLAMLNAMLIGLGELVEYLINLLRRGDPIDVQWSIDNLFATLFFPLAWIMGIESGDCSIAGELLGKKVAVNEFIAYSEMGEILKGAVVGDDGEVVSMSERTKIILTYALCGFSNFGAIGIQIGGIGPLAPSRRRDLAQLGLRAMFGGMLAACMTACMAGAMDGVLR